MQLEDILLALVSISFAAAFISLFFFFYIGRQENILITGQAKYVAKNLTEFEAYMIPNGVRQIVRSQMNVDTSDLDKEDEEAYQRNHEIEMNALKIIGISVAVILILTWFLSNKYNIDFWKIVRYGLISLGVIALTEFLFFTLIISNYINIDPNWIRADFIQEIKKNEL